MISGHSLPTPVRVRFAPSPTGTLHVGSARTALYNYLCARHQHGIFVLRIEDTDAARSTRDFEQSILDDLAWLGLEWDEGLDKGGDFAPYRQSERAAAGLYAGYAGRFLDESKAYHCFCSQGRLEQLKQECLSRNEMPKYDRRCAAISRDQAEAKLAAGEPATIRFRVPDGDVTVDDLIHGRTVFPSGVIGDFIIIRSDGAPSYNFAAVVDDIEMQITHVIRGEDHLTNTARQLLIYRALAKEPPSFAHHSLIMGPDGGKLSKRHGATSVGDFKRLGYLPGAIINYLALLSWSPVAGKEKLSLEEMEQQFELTRVAKSPAIFDIQKLNWLNGLYIRGLDAAAFHAAVEPFLQDAAAGLSSSGRLAVAEAAVQTSAVTLADAGPLVKDFFRMAPLRGEGEEVEIRDEQGRKVLELAIGMLDKLTLSYEWDSDDYMSLSLKAPDDIAAARDWIGKLKKVCQQDGIPAKRLYRTLRIALTGRTSGPELVYLLAGLGSDTVRERLRSALAFAG